MRMKNLTISKRDGDIQSYEAKERKREREGERE